MLARGRGDRRRAGADASSAWVTSWISISPWRSASAVSAATSSAAASVPYGLPGSTTHIARVRGVMAAATSSGSTEAPPGPSGHRDRPPPAAITAEGTWK